MSSSAARPTEEKEIHAFAPDFDGYGDVFAFGLLNPTYGTPEWLAQFTQSYFINLFTESEKNPNVEKIILMNGSNRQDLLLDVKNRRSQDIEDTIDRGSCFYFLVKLEAFLKKITPKIELYKILTADIFNRKDHGETFNDALNQEFTKQLYEGKNFETITHIAEMLNRGDIARTKFDDTKITLLFLHTYLLSSLFPKHKIVYNFLDDRIDLVDLLEKTFKEHSELLPHNVKVNLYQCDDPDFNNLTIKPNKMVSLTGTGKPDPQFEAHTIELFAALHETESLNKTFPEIHDRITPAIQLFKTLLQLQKDAEKENLKAPFKSVFKPIDGNSLLGSHLSESKPSHPTKITFGSASSAFSKVKK